LTSVRTALSRFATGPVAALVLIAVKYRNGSGSIVTQHDILDFSAGVLNRLTLGDLFSAPGAEIPYILGGLERGFVGSEFHLGHVSFVVLPLIWAFAINEIGIRLLAFYGMRRLLHAIGLEDEPVLAWVGATVFSLLPFYLIGFGSVAGVPLLLSAYVLVVSERRISRPNLAIFGLAPLYSAAYATLPIAFVLLLVTITIVPVIDLRSVRYAGSALGVLIGMTFLVDWRLFWISATGPVSHRTAMIHPRVFGDSFANMFASLGEENAHASAGRSLMMGVALVAGMVCLLISPRLADKRIRVITGIAAGLVVSNLLISRVWPWFESEVVAGILHDWSRFQMSRVQWMDPALLGVLFTVALVVIKRAASSLGHRSRWLIVASLFLLAGLQARSVVSRQQFVAAPDSISVEAYYASDTMSEIRQQIEADDGDLAVSVRLHPSVAIYNGISVADGYWTSYSLDYKKEFRTLIAPLLEEHPADRAYFDNWGSRAYVFLGDYGRTRCCAAPTHNEVVLNVEPSAFAPLRITHVISASVIVNAADLGLELIDTYGTEHEIGDILLYSVA